MGLHQQVMFPHQAQHPLLVDSPLLDNTPVGPDAAIPPTRGLGFEFPNPLAHACSTLGDQGRRVPAHPSHASLFFTLG